MAVEKKSFPGLPTRTFQKETGITNLAAGIADQSHPKIKESQANSSTDAELSTPLRLHRAETKACKPLSEGEAALATLHRFARERTFDTSDFMHLALPYNLESNGADENEAQQEDVQEYPSFDSALISVIHGWKNRSGVSLVGVPAIVYEKEIPGLFDIDGTPVMMHVIVDDCMIEMRTVDSGTTQTSVRICRQTPLTEISPSEIFRMQNTESHTKLPYPESSTQVEAYAESIRLHTEYLLRIVDPKEELSFGNTTSLAA